jgi:hypothetical protein
VFEEEPDSPAYTFKRMVSNVRAVLVGMLKPGAVEILDRDWVENEIIKIISMHGIKVSVIMKIFPDETPEFTDSVETGTPSSEWFLDEAKRIQAERGQQYDKNGEQTKERSMGRAVEAFNAITTKSITESEGWLLLQLLKDVRQWSNPDEFHLDSAIDSVSYASLKAESLAAKK